MAVKLSIMDRAVVERDGVAVKLEPRFMAVVIRLSLHTGRNVARAELYRDELPPGSTN